jgi:hypothetical protein
MTEQPAPVVQKKSWFARHKILTGILAIVVLVVIISVANSGGDGSPTGDEASNPSTDSSVTDTTSAESPTAPESGTPASGTSLNADAGASNRVKEGSAFTLGDFKVLRHWRVHKIGYGLGYEVKGLAVKNITNDSHTFSVEFKLHKGAHRIIADITCLANEAQPGDVVSVDCFPDGTGKAFDYVTIENAM